MTDDNWHYNCYYYYYQNELSESNTNKEHRIDVEIEEPNQDEEQKVEERRETSGTFLGEPNHLILQEHIKK